MAAKAEPEEVVISTRLARAKRDLLRSLAEDSHRTLSQEVRMVLDEHLKQAA